MRRLVVCLVLVAASADASAEPAEGNSSPGGSEHVAVEVGEEMGFMAASHARVTGSYGRRFAANRWFAEARLGFGAGTFESIVVLDQRFTGGLVFGGGGRIELLLGLRAGMSLAHREMNGQSFDQLAAVGELAPVITVAVAPRWRLRWSPILPTLFYRGTYAASVGIELGIDHAL